MYSRELLDHFKNPRNAGELPDATAAVEVTNPVCGDVLQLSVHVEGGRIAALRFMCRGCTAAIACGSALTEQLQGAATDALREVNAERVSELLGGLPEASQHAGQLAEDAARALYEALSKDGSR